MIEKIQTLLTHIKNVQENCQKIAFHLIEKGKGDSELQFARQLLANSQLHDNSKFKGIEFKRLTNKYGDREITLEELETAIHHHVSVNQHHPEFWGSIHDMPEVYLCEMVCDWAARSKELEANVREWIEKEAMKKHSFTSCCNVYRRIDFYLNILELEPEKKEKDK